MVTTSDILKARILVVDDKEANVRLLEGMLRVGGYTHVDSTMDPYAVCDLHRTNHYELILLDLRMPGLDGYQVMDGLREIETDDYLPVLVITAQPTEKLRALQSGARDFISKPFELAELMARVRNMLEVRLLGEEIRRKSDEVQKLYDDLVAEQKRSTELSLHPGTMVGVDKEERLATPLLQSLKFRHPWLQLNLLTAFAAGSVVFIFHNVIDRVVILAMFLPVLAGQSGNTGCQTLAVTLRGVFLGELKSGREKSLIRKEAMLGLLNGFLVGVEAAIVMYGVATLEHLSTALRLSVVVLLAMTGSCVISSVCGAIVPLTLKKFGADPATASSIFLTTATDMVSMGLLLGLATVLVR